MRDRDVDWMELISMVSSALFSSTVHRRTRTRQVQTKGCNSFRRRSLHRQKEEDKVSVCADVQVCEPKPSLETMKVDMVVVQGQRLVDAR